MLDKYSNPREAYLNFYLNLMLALIITWGVLTMGFVRLIVQKSESKQPENATTIYEQEVNEPYSYLEDEGEFEVTEPNLIKEEGIFGSLFN